MKIKTQILLVSIVSLIFIVTQLSRVSASPTQSVTQKATSSALTKISTILKSKGISKVPSTSSLASTASSRSKLQPAVSGDVPKLNTITPDTVKNIFWRPGVVDAIATGSPTNSQCREFFAGDVDGASGGDGACMMAEGTGLSFQIVLDSERPICYMKRLPTKANLRDGGILLTSGRIPGGDITKLFAPSTTTKIIKINAPPKDMDESDQDIFLRIPSLTSNSRKGLNYSAYIHFCDDGDTTVRGANSITVSKSGVYKIKLRGGSQDRGGSHQVTVSGFITASGESLSWDTSKARTVSIADTNDNESHKINFRIDSNNLIYLKDRTTRPEGAFQVYSITHFAGNSMKNLEFLEGAFKGQDPFSHTFTGAVEYRDTFYASSTSNFLLDDVQNYNLDGDSFFDTEPDADSDFSSLSCNPETDVELTMVPENPTLSTSLLPCNEPGFDNAQFCRSRDPSVPTIVEQARQRHFSVCTGP